MGARSDLLTPYIPAEQSEELIKCDYLQQTSTVQSVVYSDEFTVIKLPVNNSLIIISIDAVARSHLQALKLISQQIEPSLQKYLSRYLESQLKRNQFE